MMIKSSLIKLSFICLYLTSCSINGQTLRKDPVVSKYFTTNEIEDLAAVLSTFDSLMVGTNKLDKTALNTYQSKVASTINQAAEEGNCCEFLISPKLAIKILHSIPERTFTKLFKVTKVSDNHNVRLYFWPRTITKESVYRKLVSEISNPGISLYLQNISAAGDVSLSLTHQFYPQIDLADDKQRLLMAIDFIAFTIQNHADLNQVFQIAEQKSNLNEAQN
jgi:hypothetical protein